MVVTSTSLTPEGFSRLCGGVRAIEEALEENKEKKVLDIEKPVADKLRDHIKNNYFLD